MGEALKAGFDEKTRLTNRLRYDILQLRKQGKVSGSGSVVEHLLAKEKVAGSIPVSRSPLLIGFFRRRRQVVRHGSAKAAPAVRIRSSPPNRRDFLVTSFFLISSIGIPHATST